MSKTALLLSFLAVLIAACGGSSSTGPVGPPGPEGPPGADGLLGLVFEAEVDFTAANGYAALVEFPAEIEVFDTDVVLAYVLTEVDDGVDIWEPLPQTLFLGPDILLYGFDYSYLDIQFFLDGTGDLADLDSVYTTGLVFRVAIIPADFAVAMEPGILAQMVGAARIEGAPPID